MADGSVSPKMAPVLQSVSPSLRGMMTKSPQPPGGLLIPQL